jgi:large subunit ribosomal protein L13
MKSYYPKAGDVTKKWYLVDLDGMVLGRAVAEICKVLTGKNKPTYTPSVDTGDFIVAINADKVKLTGNKWSDKMYYKYTGYVGGLKSISAEKQREKDSTKIIEHAVKGMLPKNKLARQMMKKLKVFPGAEHTHEAQKPEALKIAA